MVEERRRGRSPIVVAKGETLQGAILRAQRKPKIRELEDILSADPGRTVKMDPSGEIYVGKSHAELELLVREAWAVIANASGGDWSKETLDWQVAARAWSVAAGYQATGANPPPRYDDVYFDGVAALDKLARE